MHSNEKFNIFNLEESHKNLLTKYLLFFKNKQDKFVKDINLEIEDFQNQNVREMMFSKSEVCSLLSNLKDSLTTHMENEMSYYVNMNAIFIQLLLHDADLKKVSLSVETSQVQNFENVNEMKQFVSQLISTNLPEYGKGNIVSKLGSISKTQNLINDFETLKHEYEMLKQNFDILKTQNEMLITENKNLQENSHTKDVQNLRDKLIVSNNLNQSKLILQNNYIFRIYQRAAPKIIQMFCLNSNLTFNPLKLFLKNKSPNIRNF